MKKIQNKPSKSIFGKKLLASLVAAASTCLIATSVSQASDIDIYQEAKSGQITLMMLLDISGSMGYPQLVTNASTACDIPKGITGNGRYSEQSTNGSPKYMRYACTAPSSPIYFYKRTGTKTSNYKWFSCNDMSGGSSNQSDCTIALTKAPSTTGMSSTGTSRANPKYFYKTGTSVYYDRITRLKDGLFDLLHGNTSKDIKPVSDDKVIGLATYSTPTSFNNAGEPLTADNIRGQVRIPARPLSEKVGNITQRQVLLNEIAALGARGGTPTANAYAETAAYLMGTNTARADLQAYFVDNYNRYVYCNGWNAAGKCSGSWYGWYSGSIPSGYTKGESGIIGGSSGYYYYGTDPNSASGFRNSYKATKASDLKTYQMPSSLVQNDEVKKCSGQGVYVLTDGEPNNNGSAESLMKQSLDTKGSNFSCTNSDDGWSCINNFSQALLDKSKNPLGLEIKTAVVGFAEDFEAIKSFDKNLSEAENIANIDASSAKEYVKNTAKWGVKAGGGWYSGSDSQDIVDSVNDFISNLGAEIPAVTTGSPVIPKDALNPAVLQDDAYYQQFQPTPDQSAQLWLGNLKKYRVLASGKLRDKKGNSPVNNKGEIVDNYDYWHYPVEAANKDKDETVKGSERFALKGGAWSRLPLRTDDKGVQQRKLLTNRLSSGSGSNLSFVTGNSLRSVTVDDLEDTVYGEDPYVGYFMSLLGYKVDANNPADIDLSKAGEFRQMGAVMHSEPVLVTNKGKVAFDKTTKTIGSSNREDYVLFGSTQGLLHVVDADSGKEKFAFVPNEMMERQRQAFLKADVATGGLNKLYYGIDGPWMVHTEYVVDSSGNLVVDSGKGNQKGKQIAYGGLRMGGRSYYALNLQNINSPSLQFHIDPASKKVYRSGGSKTFNELQYMGQSWSKPSIGYVNWGGKRKLVMFVGGGYDAGGDVNSTTGVLANGAYGGYEVADYNQTSKIGAGVYMFDAGNGELLWWASDNATASSNANANSGVIATKYSDLKYSVAGQIRTVDRDGDDLIDHIYFGDLAGQVFRIDLDNKASKLGGFAKAPVRLLNLNKSAGKSPRFYDMPGFSLYNNAGTTFAVLSIGSGNRSLPLNAYTSTDSSYEYDAIYNLYDKDVARRDLYSASSWNTKDRTRSHLGAITENNRHSDTSLVAAYSDKDGWYYDFSTCTAGVDGTKTSCSDYKKQSEKVFGTPLAMNNRLYVSTFDASKPGISGDCGAGVKGESLISTFCLPYGQCNKKLDEARQALGAGIHTITVGNDPSSNGDGNNGSGNNGGGNGGGNGSQSGVGGSTQNYCISTGGRMTITVAGGISTGEQTRMCLIPQRWYEKFR